MGLLEIILIALGVLALISAIYGALRRFSRITWIGWQLLIAFGITVAFGQIQSSGTGGFVLSLVGFTVAAAVPLIAEFFGRKLLVTDRILQPRMGEMVFDRIFGAVTAILATLSFFLVVGVFGLAFAESVSGKVFLDVGIWTGFLKKYALDFFTVALYLIVLRAGCRLGVLNGLRTLLVFLLLAGGFFGSFLLATRVGFGVSFSHWIGGLFGLPSMLGSMVGAVIATFLFTLVCFIVIMLLNKLMDMGIRRLRGVTAVGIIDSLLTGILFGAVFIAVTVGLYTGYAALSQVDFGAMFNDLLGQAAADMNLGSAGDVLSRTANSLIEFVRSSPLSGMLYDTNPLAALINHAAGSGMLVPSPLF